MTANNDRWWNPCHRPMLLCLVILEASSQSLGCSARKVEVAKVSGTVLLDGEPLTNAIVVFEPRGGRPSRGRTNEDGHYQLLYTFDTAGAVVGPCSVTISTAVELEDGSFAPERVPRRYFDPKALAVEVRPRGNVLDFKLSTKTGD